MPGSSTIGKLQVVEWVDELCDIKSIIDIGPGWGTYAKLLSSKKIEIDAIEIFKDYIQKINLNKYYKKIYNTNVCDFIFQKKYDLAILGDILEHITKRRRKKSIKQYIQ